MGAEGRLLTANNAEQIADWCGGRTAIQHSVQDDDAAPIIGVNVPTPDGVKRAQPGDFIVRSHTGVFYIRTLPAIENGA